jgi:hypothetical protein
MEVLPVNNAYSLREKLITVEYSAGIEKQFEKGSKSHGHIYLLLPLYQNIVTYMIFLKVKPYELLTKFVQEVLTPRV